MKTYLLIAGNSYYPGAGTDDWIGCFSTKKEAEQYVKELKIDWHEIVDLEEWMKKESK